VSRHGVRARSSPRTRLAERTVMDGARVAGIVDESDIVLAWSAEPFDRAARTLLREDLRALPVVSEHGELIGILTATDILRAVAECATPDEA
jgi:CBS domain-containing protein